jgi:hypothetical protein
MGYFTTGWGIFIESWYVGRWTIVFNVAPMVVILMTVDLGGFLVPLIIYTIISIVLAGTTGAQTLKHLVGAKSYGALTLALAMMQQGSITGDQVLSNWFLYSLAIYGAWAVVRLVKQRYEYPFRY